MIKTEFQDIVILSVRSTLLQIHMQGTLYRQIDRLTHRQKDTQIDIQTGRSRHTDRWLVRKSSQVDRQPDLLTNRCMHIDKGQIYEQIKKERCVQCINKKRKKRQTHNHTAK